MKRQGACRTSGQVRVLVATHVVAPRVALAPAAVVAGAVAGRSRSGRRPERTAGALIATTLVVVPDISRTPLLPVGQTRLVVLDVGIEEAVTPRGCRSDTDRAEGAVDVLPLLLLTDALLSAEVFARHTVALGGVDLLSRRRVVELVASDCRPPKQEAERNREHGGFQNGHAVLLG